MRAGQLRHRITAQTVTTAADAAGQPIETWADWLISEPAELIETGGAETLRGQQIDATATHLVRVRYRAAWQDSGERRRIVFGARIIGVTNVRDVDGRRRELWITGAEVKA